MLKKSDNLSNLRTKNIDNELLIYNLDNNSLHILNETAAAIWKLCGENSSANYIVESILKEYEGDYENVLRYVKAVIAQFKTLGLLKECED